jgi:hypothetical protein
MDEHQKGDLAMRTARLVGAGITAVALLAITPSASAYPTLAAVRLPCAAHMSDSRPADYTTTDVLVHTSAHAKVVTRAHYKPTTPEAVNLFEARVWGI